MELLEGEGLGIEIGPWETEKVSQKLIVLAKPGFWSHFLYFPVRHDVYRLSRTLYSVFPVVIDMSQNKPFLL